MSKNVTDLRNWAMDLATSIDPDEQEDAGKLIWAANEIERLRAALAYYASPHHWVYGEVPGHVYAHDDAGRSARKTLGLPTRIPDGEEFAVELQCRELMDK